MQAAAYHDFSSFGTLRAQARQDSAGASSEVAKQFESIFIQIMLKSMREAVPKGGLFDSDQMTMYQEMFDQQISLDLSRGGGIGLAEVIERQLGGDAAAEVSPGNAINPANIRFGAPDPFVPLLESIPLPRAKSKLPAPPAADAEAQDWGRVPPSSFVAHIRRDAAAAAVELGVSENLLIAQAALETGWGQKVIRHRTGENSFNLFGIKAGQSWQGATVNRLTLEYQDGIAQKQFAEFRAYPSAGEAFADYVAFLRGNPRYAEVLASAGSDRHFAEALQSAGYATDPAYASKILAIKQQLDQAPTMLASETTDESPVL